MKNQNMKFEDGSLVSAAFFANWTHILILHHVAKSELFVV